MEKDSKKKRFMAANFIEVANLALSQDVTPTSPIASHFDEIPNASNIEAA